MNEKKQIEIHLRPLFVLSQCCVKILHNKGKLFVCKLRWSHSEANPGSVETTSRSGQGPTFGSENKQITGPNFKMKTCKKFFSGSQIVLGPRQVEEQCAHQHSRARIDRTLTMDLLRACTRLTSSSQTRSYCLVM